MKGRLAAAPLGLGGSFFAARRFRFADDDFRVVEWQHIKFDIEAIPVRMCPSGSDFLPEAALASLGHCVDLVAGAFRCRGHDLVLSFL